MKPARLYLGRSFQTVACVIFRTMLLACAAITSLAADEPPSQAGVPEGPYTRSTFHCLSVYWSRPQSGACAVEYRKTTETTWHQAQDLWYDKETGTKLMHQYRGSIVNLAPGTEYEIRLTAGKDISTLSAATWSEEFKIKKTIKLPSGMKPFRTTEGGDAQSGYVLYDGTGETLDLRGSGPGNGVNINHNFVILRGLTIIGAYGQGIAIASNKTDIVIEKCDISDWGRPETKPSGPGNSFVFPPADQIGRVDDGGINIPNCQRVVVQRCKIHDPHFRTALWDQYPQFGGGHSHGPKALIIGNSDLGSWEANHVFRYNELYSANDHPFDDTFGGWPNYSKVGCPGPDSDIYCNIIMHAADDLIEADGGGQNVRVWGNYLDSGLTAISYQSLTVGPAYFFRNVIANGIGKIRNGSTSGNLFKLVGSNPAVADQKSLRKPAFFWGPLYVYHNTSLITNALGFGTVFDAHPGDDTRNVVSRNNIFVSYSAYVRDRYKLTGFVDSSFDYDLHNNPIRVNQPLTADAHGITALPVWPEGSGPSAPPPLLANGIGKYQPSPRSPGHNQGIALPNFNRGSAEEGGAPDFGAVEFGAPDMVFGVNAHWKP